MLKSAKWIEWIEFITSAYLQLRRGLGLHKFLIHSYIHLVRRLSHIYYNIINFLCLSLYFPTSLVKPSNFTSLPTLFHFISFRFIRFSLLYLLLMLYILFQYIRYHSLITAYYYYHIFISYSLIHIFFFLLPSLSIISLLFSLSSHLIIRSVIES